jgi:FdhD protein
VSAPRLPAQDDIVDGAVRTVPVTRLDAVAGGDAREDAVAHEEPLEIQVNGASVAVVMRSPGHDEDLARGFLLTERVIRSLDEIESIRHCDTVPDPEAEDNVIQIRLRPGVPFDLERLRRHMFASSSCGVCGKATIENACATAPPLALPGRDDARLAAAVLTHLPERLRAAQRAFSTTGGLHAAGVFTLEGEPVVVREDVGRHNAVDKAIGYVAHRNIESKRHLLFVSGRVSFELVQKAAAAGLPILAGISAPTSLAVRMGRALGVTVIGFVRGTSMNVYSIPERVAP